MMMEMMSNVKRNIKVAFNLTNTIMLKCSGRVDRVRAPMIHHLARISNAEMYDYM